MPRFEMQQAREVQEEVRLLNHKIVKTMTKVPKHDIHSVTKSLGSGNSSPPTTTSSLTSACPASAQSLVQMQPNSGVDRPFHPAKANTAPNMKSTVNFGLLNIGEWLLSTFSQVKSPLSSFAICTKILWA
jgi:hypothetical protein